MRVVVQKVIEASVSISGAVKTSIGKGLVVLVGIEESDDLSDIEWLARKIVNMRIFDDADGTMNRSVVDEQGEVLIISQFTLHASTKKGNRPSYIKAASPAIAIPVYEKFIEQMATFGLQIATGEFGADMKVSLINDGPVTIVIDTKNKE